MGCCIGGARFVVCARHGRSRQFFGRGEGSAARVNGHGFCKVCGSSVSVTLSRKCNLVKKLESWVLAVEPSPRPVIRSSRFSSSGRQGQATRARTSSVNQLGSMRVLKRARPRSLTHHFSTSAKHQTDAIVIGGGIAGSSVAYNLVKYHGLKVTILEQEEYCGYHSTGRAAGLFSENYGEAPVQILSMRSRLWLDNPPDDCKGPDFQPLLSPRSIYLL